MHETEQEIQALISGGESLAVEFKSDIKSLPDRDLVAAVVALANTEGGDLFLARLAGTPEQAATPGVGDGQGQRIRGIGRRCALELQQRHDHVLDLDLGCGTAADKDTYILLALQPPLERVGPVRVADERPVHAAGSQQPAAQQPTQQPAQQPQAQQMPDYDSFDDDIPF